MKPPAHSLAPARALTCTRLAGLDIGLKRRCTEENQSVCCVVHGRQSCPDGGRCLLLLTLSSFTGVEPTTVLRTPVRYVEGFVGARSPDPRASQKHHISVIASFADGRAHATCNLLGMCGHLSSLFGMKQTRKSPDRAGWLA